MSGYSTALTNEMQKLSNETKRKYPQIKEAAERVVVIIRANSSFANPEIIEPFFLSCKTKNVKIVTIALSFLQTLIMFNSVPNKFLEEIVLNLKDSLELGDEVQIKVLQLILPLVTFYKQICRSLLSTVLELCFELANSKNRDLANSASATIQQMLVVVFDRVSFEIASDSSKQFNEDKSSNDSRKRISQNIDLNSNNNKTSEESLDNSETLLKKGIERLKIKPESDFYLDASDILKDLCALVANKRLHFISVSNVDTGFVLETIELIISSHSKTFIKDPSVFSLLKNTLAPFLMNLFTKSPSFRISIRQTRIILKFIKEFYQQLPLECEVFLSTFRQILMTGTFSNAKKFSKANSVSPITPQSPLSDIYTNQTELSQPSTTSELAEYNQAVAAEALLRICIDTNLFLSLYRIYGCQNDGNQTVYLIIKDMCRYVSEKSDILFSASMANTGTLNASTDLESFKKQIGYSSFSFLSVQNKNSKLNLRFGLLDMLDKVDPPLLNETHLFIISFFCLVELSTGLSNLCIPPCSQPVTFNSTHNTKSPKIHSNSNLPNSVFSSEPDGISSTVSKKVSVILSDREGSGLVKDMEVKKDIELIKLFLDSTWPELLSTLSFLSKLSFPSAEQACLVQSMENYIKILGVIGNKSGYTSFITSLCACCLPRFETLSLNKKQSSISPLPKSDPNETKSQENEIKSDLDVNLDVSGTKKQPLSVPLTEYFDFFDILLSEANIRSLSSLANCAKFLSPILKEEWYLLVVTFQQAEEILHQNNFSFRRKHETNSSLARDTVAFSPTSFPNDPLYKIYIDHQLVVSEYESLFQLIPQIHDSDSLGWFLYALCLLNLDLTGAPEQDRDSPIYLLMKRSMSKSKRIPAVLNRVCFSIKCMLSLTNNHIDSLLSLNSPSLSDKPKQTLWELFVYQLLDTATFVNTPQALRTQACDALSESVLSAMSYVLDAAKTSADSETGEFAGTIQRSNYYGDVQIQALMPLAEMISVTKQSRYESDNYSRFSEVQSLALSTLNQLLQTSGHSICNAWDVVFDILESAVESTSELKTKSPSANAGAMFNTAASTRENSLVRIAFPSLQLVCTDFIGNLSLGSIRRCVSVLGSYAHQSSDLNVALTSVGLMWNITDFLLSSNNNELRDKNGSIIKTESTLGDGQSIVSAHLEKLLADYFGKKIPPSLSAFADLWKFIQTCEFEGDHSSGNIELLFLFALFVLLKLCIDDRHEMRSSSIKTLFSTLDIYGANLSSLSWDIILWAILNPLILEVSSMRSKIFIQDWDIPKFVISKSESFSDGALSNSIRYSETNADSTQGFTTSKENAVINTRLNDIEVSESGLYVEHPKFVRFKTWDETISTIMINIVTILVSRLSREEPQTEKLSMCIIYFMSWLNTLAYGSAHPIRTHHELFNIYCAILDHKNNAPSSENVSQDLKGFPDALLMTLETHSVHPAFRIVFQGKLLIDTVVESYRIFEGFLCKLSETTLPKKKHDNSQPIYESNHTSQTDLFLNKRVVSCFALMWDSLVLFLSSCCESVSRARSRLDSTLTTVSDFSTSGVSPKNLKSIIEILSRLAIQLGPKQLNKLTFEDYGFYFRVLKFALFSEYDLSVKDLYNMTPLQLSIWDSLSSFLGTIGFSKNSSFSSLQNINSGNPKKSRVYTINYSSNHHLTELLLIYFDFVSYLSVLPFLPYIVECKDKETMLEKYNLPVWSIKVFESFHDWIKPIDIDFLLPFSNEAQLKSKGIKSKRMPTFFAISKHSLESINQIIFKLSLLSYFDDQIPAEMPLELSKENEDSDMHKLSSLPEDKGFSLNFFNLAFSLASSGILETLIESCSLMLACWDSFNWGFLSHQPSDSDSDLALSLTSLRPIWDISMKTLPDLVSFTFELFMLLQSSEIRPFVDRFWSITFEVVNEVLFLPPIYISKYRESHSNGYDINFTSNNIVYFKNTSSSEKVPTQLSVNYTFPCSFPLEFEDLVFRCPPPSLTDLDIKDPALVQKYRKSNSLESGLNTQSSDLIQSKLFDPLLNSIMISALRFISSITSYSSEEKLISSLSSFNLRHSPITATDASFNVNSNFKKGNHCNIQSKENGHEESENLTIEPINDSSDQCKNSGSNSFGITNDEKTQTGCEYKRVVVDLFTLLCKISGQSTFSKESQTYNSIGINTGSILTNEIFEPYKNLAIVDSKFSLTLCALHWLFVLSSKSSNFVTLPITQKYADNDKSRFLGNSKVVDDIPSLQQNIDINQTKESFSIASSLYCMPTNKFYTNHGKMDIQNQENICSYGEIPGFNDRPLVPLWVSKLSSVCLVYVAAKLISEYLGLDKICFCWFNDVTRFIDLEVNENSFYSNVQIVFLLKHLVYLECIPNIFSEMLNDTKQDQSGAESTLLEQILVGWECKSLINQDILLNLGCKLGKVSCDSVVNLHKQHLANNFTEDTGPLFIVKQETSSNFEPNSDGYEYRSNLAKIKNIFLSGPKAHIYILYNLIQGMGHDRQKEIRNLSQICLSQLSLL
ncbi:hypothetical protein BB560_001385 [Smittium megazygosporum]|uniref:Protein MON2 homolog n=1 Tax=Smittium megazygosporum TaxID=133381 RepID=A0A2T9ZHS3_9FUNG|nr:hypothetical protein BB560_001385 [Smittium megazygosporum]